MIVARNDAVNNDGLEKNIVMATSSDGHETDGTILSSGSSKTKDTQDVTILENASSENQASDTASMVVGTPRARRMRSSITRLLCCVNEDDLGKDAASDDRPFPAVYTSSVTSWTKKTRISFERNIATLLSSCDSRGKPDLIGSGGKGIAWSAAYEKRYRDMVQEGITNLEEEVEKDEEKAKKCDEMVEPTPVSSLTALRRGFSPRARTTRLRMLRRKMTPDGATKRVNGLYKKTQSFDDHVLRQHSRSNSAPPGDLRRLGALHSLTRDDTSRHATKKRGSTTLARVFEGACECGAGANSMPVDDDMYFPDRSLLSDDDLAYDSDPEICPSRKTFTGSFSLAKSVSKEDDTTASVSDDEDTLPEVSSGDAADAAKRSTEIDRGLNLFDEEQTSELIEEFVNTSMTLIWHPPKLKDKSLKNGAPTCVKAWIELGCRVKGQIIQPKLVWRNVHQQEVNVIATPSPLGSIDVLDISRVLASSDIDRNEFPLAMKNKSFRITTSEQQEYLFEVADGAEKDRIVLSLKLLVARLASLIIVGDQQIFDEFFYPSSSSDFQRKYDIEE